MKVYHEKQILLLLISFLAFKPLIAMESNNSNKRPHEQKEQGQNKHQKTVGSTNNNNNRIASHIPSLTTLCSSIFTDGLQEINAQELENVLADKFLENLNQVPAIMKAIKRDLQLKFQQFMLKADLSKEPLNDHKYFTFCRDGYLASESDDKTIGLYAANGGKPILIKRLDNHKKLGPPVAFNDYLASGSDDKTVGIYALDNLKLIDYLHKKEKEISIEQVLILLLALKSNQPLHLEEYSTMLNILRQNQELFGLLENAKLITLSDVST